MATATTGAPTMAQPGTLPESLARSNAARELPSMSRPKNQISATATAVAIVAAGTAYLAFGRHLAVKLIGVAVVVAALAAPGLALGWANGTVSVVAHRTAEQELSLIH